MSPVAGALIAEFEASAVAAREAEDALRKRLTAEVSNLERERAFAYRRLNLMRAVTGAIASVESEETAVANGLAVVRAELGWESDSDSRAETLSRFASVLRSAFTGLSPSKPEGSVETVVRSLADFEAWYATTYERPFWVLFEQEIPEMPLVER